MRRLVLAVAVAVSAGQLEGQLIDRSTVGTMNASVEAAERELVIWLNLVRDGSPRAAWDRGSPHFQQSVLPETWEHVWSGVADGLQPVINRKVTSLRYVPIEPDRYPEAVIFDTRVEFRGGTFGGETVIMAQEGGAWRVWEYAISPSTRYLAPGANADFFERHGRVVRALPSPSPAPANPNVNRVAPRPRPPG